MKSLNKLGIASLTIISLIFWSFGGILPRAFPLVQAQADVPPFVETTNPDNGALDIPTNLGKAIFSFSRAMDTSTFNTTNITVTPSVSYSVSYSSDGFQAYVVFGASLTANTQYTITLSTSITDSGGTALASAFNLSFTTGSSADTSTPQAMGSSLDQWKDSNGNIVNVPVNVGNIGVGFDVALDPTTVITSNVTLENTTSSAQIAGNVAYEPGRQAVVFYPSQVLSTNTQYTFTISTGVKSYTGVALASTYTKNFTTSATGDTTPPNISYVDIDNFGVFIQFTEPMVQSEVTNKSNYTIKQAPPGTFGPAWNSVSAQDLTSADIHYDYGNNTVEIMGVAFTPGNDFLVQIDRTGVHDLAGNEMADYEDNSSPSANPKSNPYRGIVANADNFEGGSGMFGGPGEMDMDQMGMTPVSVMPMTPMAGITTNYFVDFPTTQALSNGDRIEIEFPSGFSLASAAPRSNSPVNNDMNGPGPGIVTFDTSYDSDGVSGDDAARTVTIQLSISGTGIGGGTQLPAQDFLSLDLKNITNPSLPSSADSSGYQATIKTKHLSGGNWDVLESKNAMPIFISSPGSNSISGKVTADSDANGAFMSVFLGSPMTGHMEQEITFSNASSSYEFTNLPDGTYFIFTEPVVSLNNNDYLGSPMPEPLDVSGGASVTKNFTISKASDSGTALTVSLTGDFSTDGTADDIDIFAGGPQGFTVKTLEDVGNVTNQNYTLYIPATSSANGTWFVGIGPSIPKGPMMGPPPETDWLMPKPQEVKVSGCPSSCSLSPSSLSFTISTADKTVSGYVRDASGNAVANAEVFAYSPTEMFGTHTQALNDGSFSLSIVTGSFKMGAFMPGMPMSQEVSLEVDDSGNVYINGSATPTSSVILKIAKPDYTISGQVTDGTNVASEAVVFAYKTDGPGHTETMTDSSGNYVLYVNSGTWHVGVFLPAYGELPERTVTITDSSVGNIDFAPTSGTYYTISGKVCTGSSDQSGNNVCSGESAVTNARVWAQSSSGGNDASVGSDGTYSMKVPAASSYTIKAWTPDGGELIPITSVDVSSSDVSGQDFMMTTPQDVTVNFSSSVDEAFVDFYDSTNDRGNHIRIENASTTSLTLPNGTYDIHIFVPSIGKISSSDISGNNVSNGQLTVSGSAETVTVTLSTLYTLSGTVYHTSATSGNELGRAWVEVSNISSGLHFGKQAGSDGSFSISLPAGTYDVTALKPGYIGQPISITVSGSTSQNILLTQGSRVISGYIYKDANSNSSFDSGEGLTPAFVRAEKLGGGFAGVEADATGYYELTLDSGDWRLYGVAEGYQEGTYSGNPLTVASTNLSNINIAVGSAVSLASPKTKPITPSSGGTVEDSSTKTTLVIPANVLGSSSSAGQIRLAETSNVFSTASASPLEGKAREITATDANSNPITTLNGNVTIEMEYSKSELTSAGISTLSALQNIKLAYWNDSTSAWVTIPTTVILHPSTATTFDSLDSSPAVTFRGTTNHFSSFAPISPTDPAAPATPTGLSASPGNQRVSLSWNANTESDLSGYYVYRDTSSSGSFPLLAGVATNSYTDTSSLSNGTTYYYKVSAYDTSGNESAASGAVSATPAGAVYVPSGGSRAAAPSPVTEEKTLEQEVVVEEEALAEEIGQVGIGEEVATPWSEGSLVKTADDPKIYLVRDGKRFWIPTWQAFTSLGYQLANVQNVSPDDMALVAEVALVKRADSPRVYVLVEGRRRHIPNPEVFKDYGYNWQDIVTVSASEMAAFPEVTLIRAKGDYKVYLIDQGLRRWIKTAEIFKARGYKWQQVNEVSLLELESYNKGETITE